MGNVCVHSNTLTKDEIQTLRMKIEFRFTEEEIRQWYRKFHKDYPNGCITEEEFVEMYESLYKEGDPTSFARIVFKAYDADGDGKINFEEFLTTTSISSRGSADEKLEWAFKMYDLNGSGTVSKNDIIKTLVAIYRLKGDFRTHRAQETANLIFTNLDKDKDDEITQREFILGVKKAGVLDVLHPLRIH